jgi:hypothetical protein
MLLLYQKYKEVREAQVKRKAKNCPFREKKSRSFLYIKVSVEKTIKEGLKKLLLLLW